MYYARKENMGCVGCLSGLGQAVPPVRRETVNTVVWASVGLVAFSLGAYLLLTRKKKGSTDVR